MISFPFKLYYIYFFHPYTFNLSIHFFKENLKKKKYKHLDRPSVRFCCLTSYNMKEFFKWIIFFIQTGITHFVLTFFYNTHKFKIKTCCKAS